MYMIEIDYEFIANSDLVVDGQNLADTLVNLFYAR